MARGREAFIAAMRRQTPWINGLAEGTPVADIATTHRVIATIRERLEATEGAEAQRKPVSGEDA